jgi:hypothetical protein
MKISKIVLIKLIVTQIYRNNQEKLLPAWNYDHDLTNPTSDFFAKRFESAHMCQATSTCGHLSIWLPEYFTDVLNGPNYC